MINRATLFSILVFCTQKKHSGHQVSFVFLRNVWLQCTGWNRNVNPIFETYFVLESPDLQIADKVTKSASCHKFDWSWSPNPSEEMLGW